MDDRKINPRVYLGLVAYALGSLQASGTMRQDPKLATTFGYAGAIIATIIFVWFLAKSRGSVIFRILMFIGLVFLCVAFELMVGFHNLGRESMGF